MSVLTSIFAHPTDPRLKRHVVRDDRSWGFPLPDVSVFEGTMPRAVQHARVIPVLDQGDVGSCTANALLGCLGTEPFASMIRERYVDLATFDEALALAVYHDETIIDEREIPGVYPPDDTGSAGIYAMKVAQRRRWIVSYRHGFSFSSTLAGLVNGPIMVGTLWLESMFNVDDEGAIVVDRQSKVAGGHEWVVDGYDLDEGVVRMTNSWGTSWGTNGTAKVRLGDLRWLLAGPQQGDVVQPGVLQ